MAFTDAISTCISKSNSSQMPLTFLNVGYGIAAWQHQSDCSSDTYKPVPVSNKCNIVLAENALRGSSELSKVLANGSS